ncbi:MAG: esterase family protein [Planctomycetes bacterium]|nr:esterase family protein [Planctomycetota bacterium]
MAFLDIHFSGAAIQKQSSMYVIMPEGKGAGPFPVLYLLHGYSDDHTIWLRRTRIEAYVESLPLIVVMPDGHHSFYCNDPRPNGMAYEDHIIKDVVGFIDRTLPTIANRSGRAIAGLSMGGYGAMMYAMKHPDIFCAAASHSGALQLLHKPRADRPHLIELAKFLPAKDYNLFELSARLKKSGKKLALRIDCGTEDFLLDENRGFHAHLNKLGIGHFYKEYPGSHNWDYWDVHIRETLSFVMNNVKKPKMRK